MKTNPEVTARINKRGFGESGLLSPERVAEIRQATLNEMS
jgi:hypothetical protein